MAGTRAGTARNARRPAWRDLRARQLALARLVPTGAYWRLPEPHRAAGHARKGERRRPALH
eukprot:7380673-Prymnesium_polylepis.1